MHAPHAVYSTVGGVSYLTVAMYDSLIVVILILQ